MRGVCRPIRIRIVRRNDLDSSAGLCDAMKLRDKGHHIGHMLYYVTADDLIEPVVVERIRNNAQVMYDIGSRARVKVYADCARILVAPTANVQDFLLKVFRLSQFYFRGQRL